MGIKDYLVKINKTLKNLEKSANVLHGLGKGGHLRVVKCRKGRVKVV